MDTSYNIKQPRKTFSKIGFILTAVLLMATVVQVLLLLIPVIFKDLSWISSSSWWLYLISLISVYLIAMPAGYLLLRRLPSQAPDNNKLGANIFLSLIPIALFISYTGSIIGTVISSVLSGGTAVNPVEDFVSSMNPIAIIAAVIFAPLFEEYIFRKQIIDCTRKYGEKTAVFLSAITFALFHLNLFQFFYAFALGLLFAYVYIRTGRLHYTIIIHAIINFMGSVVSPLVLSLIDIEAIELIAANPNSEQIISENIHALSGVLILLIYFMFLFAMYITGLIFLILKRKQIFWKEAECELPKGKKICTVYLNVGIIVFVLLCAVNIVFSLM